MLGDYDNSADLERTSDVQEELKMHTVSCINENGAHILSAGREHLLTLQELFPMAGALKDLRLNPCQL
jgi:hypothetical protein